MIVMVENDKGLSKILDTRYWILDPEFKIL